MVTNRAYVTSLDKQSQPAFVVAFLGAVSRDDACLILLEALCRLSVYRPAAERAVLFLRTNRNASIVYALIIAVLRENCLVTEVFRLASDVALCTWVVDSLLQPLFCGVK